MNTLLIGSGGREHALALALSKSKSMDKLYCTPGNPGIFRVAEKAEIDLKFDTDIIEFCKSQNVELVVVGPHPLLHPHQQGVDAAGEEEHDPRTVRQGLDRLAEKHLDPE